MQDVNKCRTRLIEDSPALEDAFASNGDIGPHQRVADALLNIISTESGGKMIGLEGGWGIGKSTVVTLLAQKLKERQGNEVIVFDAWAHEGDPLRRTYLETLIRHLQNCKWVDKKPWDDKLNTIANRRRTETTKIVPKPTVLGKRIGIAALLVPFGLALVSAALSEGVTIELGRDPSWKFLVGTFFSLAPLFVLLYSKISIGYRKIRGKPIECDEESFLISDAITETTTETIETPNPTSIEFEDHFSDLMSEAIGSGDNRLLLVLDNLDRVDASLALQLWSTLQTFLHDRSYRAEDWFQRLWVIVPFDPNGLRKLWDNHSKDSDSPNIENERTVSDSFLDKSFQVRLRVPPPLLTDWKGFLCKLVESALPDHSDKDQHDIYRVYDQCRPDKSTPTPRQLKLYVNQIGAIHRQWEDAIPIAHVAYFVVMSKNNSGMIKQLESGTLPEGVGKRMLDGNLAASLAGLVFNVSPEKGLELLLGESIIGALSSGNHERLNELEQQHAKGFWTVLEIVLAPYLVSADSGTLAKTASCLRHSGLFSSAECHELATVRQLLKSTALEKRDWGILDNDIAGGISSLIALYKDETLSAHIAKTLKSNRKSKQSDEDASPETHLSCLCSIFEEFEAVSHFHLVPQGYELALTAEEWVKFSNVAGSCDPEQKYLSKVRPTADFKGVLEILKASVNAGDFSDVELASVAITESSSLSTKWGELVLAMESRLSASIDAPQEEAKLLLKALADIKSFGSDEAVTALANLADGHVLHHLYAIEDGLSFKALCIYVFLDNKPAAEPPTAIGNSAHGHIELLQLLENGSTEIAQLLSSTAISYGDYGFYWRVIDEREKCDPLMRECLEREVEGAPEHVFSLKAIRARWGQIQRILNHENSGLFKKLLEKLKSETKICSKICTSDIPFEQSDATFYVWLHRAEPQNAQFDKWCCDGLGSLGEIAWIKDLNGNNAAVYLAVELMESGHNLELPSIYSDALREHAKSVAAGEQSPSDDLKSKWEIVLQPIGMSGTRKVFQDKLLDIAIEVGGEIHKDFFQLYGTEINQHALLAANERTVSHLFTPLLHARNLAGLNWLLDFLRGNQEFFNAFSADHAVEDFQQRIVEKLNAPEEDEAQEVIESIGNALGLVASREEERDDAVLPVDSDSGKEES